ncbi:MAG TPA: hypothetical protein VKJ00_15545 [Thermoanaerobaculia bacterium]|nr:hypothetical protein [Thermoanaerobaculia bacterium]
MPGIERFPPLQAILFIIGIALAAVRSIWPRVPVKARPWVIAGVSLFIIALYAWIIFTLAHLNNQ